MLPQNKKQNEKKENRLSRAQFCVCIRVRMSFVMQF